MPSVLNYSAWGVLQSKIHHTTDRQAQAPQVISQPVGAHHHRRYHGYLRRCGGPRGRLVGKQQIKQRKKEDPAAGQAGGRWDNNNTTTSNEYQNTEMTVEDKQTRTSQRVS
ncbi:unnamed protein product [Caenorhabditis sp. 36 PRJEB53466]|nr:unnamed protein product [Caenorhabditis sp. 36 PRJEB53466]